MGGNSAIGTSPRSFLFLQGPIGPFFSRLAQRLAADGHAVHRINFHGGDRLFWRLAGAVDFRGGAAEWPAFLCELLGRRCITDLVLFGDCRPMHRVALAAAAERKLPAHVFEEGYLRPNWITLERGGVNGNSLLPHDPQYYRESVRSAPRRGETPVASSFVRRAFEDVLYHTAMAVTRHYYRGYRTHRPWHPYVDYAHAAGRFLHRPLVKRRTVARCERLAARPQHYFVFPLQLDADTQIRHHSVFRRMQPAIEHVIASFARHAPGDALLSVTEHPLETGVAGLKLIVDRCAADFGVHSRVVYFEGGTPDRLLRGSRGVITVNSTIGLRALSWGLPVTTLGQAVYALPGLTFQGTVDEFWRHAAPPDPILFAAFRRVLVVRTQINGGFYSASGISMAVREAASRLQQEPALGQSVREQPARLDPDLLLPPTAAAL